MSATEINPEAEIDLEEMLLSLKKHQAEEQAFFTSLLSTEPEVTPTSALLLVPTPTLASTSCSVESPSVPYTRIRYTDLVFTERKPLGTGNYAQVFKGKWRQQEVAIKKFFGTAEQKTIQAEAVIMAEASSASPYVISLYAACDETPYCLIMEYMPRGNLYHLLSNQPALPWSIRYNIALTISSALSALHAVDILHNDLASTNIFLDENYQAKLGDFGLAIRTKVGLELSDWGAPQWLAPEVVSQGKVSQASDVYSLGMVLWELASWKTPYKDLSSQQVMERIKQKHKETILLKIPAELKALIEACWQDEPVSRPSAQTVAQCVTSLLKTEREKEQKQQEALEAKRFRVSAQVTPSVGIFAPSETKSVTVSPRKRKQAEFEKTPKKKAPTGLKLSQEILPALPSSILPVNHSSASHSNSIR